LAYVSVSEVKSSAWSGAAAAAYDMGFARLCQGAVGEVLDRVERLSGVGSLLDLGAGTGRLSTEAQRRGFAVTAVDREPDMLAIAERRAPDLGVTWTVAEAPELPFAEDSFDAAAANFVINHVAKPREVLGALGRVVVGDGVIATTIWPSGPSPLSELWQQVVAASGAIAPPPNRLGPADDFERSVEGLAGLHSSCELTVEFAGTVAWTLMIDPLDFWQGPASGIAVIGALYLAQPEPVRERMFAAYWDAVADRTRDGYLHLEARAALVISRVPR
jgi:SAM-dependent methyltransferase